MSLISIENFASMDEQNVFVLKTQLERQGNIKTEFQGCCQY